MNRNRILKSVVESRPYKKWNSMIDLLFNTEILDMTQIQKDVYLCLWYDSEVHIYNIGTIIIYYKEMCICLDICSKNLLV